ncbi:MAG: histidine phosphatase family protein [Fusobacteriaceae bacterium]
MELFILRHGETKWNELKILQGSLNSDLLESTIEKTLILKERFKIENLKFDIICTSSSLRTIETAKLLGYDSSEIIIREDFCELGMGTVQGKTYEEFASLHPQEYHNYFNNSNNYNPLGFQGESFVELSKRIERGMNELKREFSNKKVLLITHGVTIQGIISFINNGYVNLDDFSKITPPNNLEVYTFSLI